MSVGVAMLARLLPPESAYPAGVIAAISPRVRGRSFFPGGCGLAGGDTSEMPSRPIMLVGQDFGTLSYWRSLDEGQIARGEPTESGTWAGIERLAAAGVLPLSRCFFTNALLGVRDDTSGRKGEITGPSPGLAHASYVEASLTCLEAQLRHLQPCAVVALGTVPATLLARRFGLPCPSWPNTRIPPRSYATIARWSEIDGAGLQFVPPSERELPFAFAAVTHPSDGRNARHRTWRCRGLAGRDADLAIWQAVAAFDRSLPPAPGPPP